MKFVLMFGCNVWVYELKIIKLLMLNFTCLWCIYMYTCVLPINDEKWIVVDGLLMKSCLIDVFVVMRYCCWWFIPWVFIISDLWYELSCYEGFVKMGWISELCWNNIWFHVWCVFWKPFWVYEPVNNLWKHIWVLGDQNWGRTRKLLCRTVDKRAPSVQPLYA